MHIHYSKILAKIPTSLIVIIYYMPGSPLNTRVMRRPGMEYGVSFSIIFYLIHLKWSLLLNLETGWLPENDLIPHTITNELWSHVSSHQIFYMDSGIKTQLPILSWQTFFPLSHVFSLSNILTRPKLREWNLLPKHVGHHSVVLFHYFNSHDVYRV